MRVGLINKVVPKDMEPLPPKVGAGCLSQIREMRENQACSPKMRVSMMGDLVGGQPVVKISDSAFWSSSEVSVSLLSTYCWAVRSTGLLRTCS